MKLTTRSYPRPVVGNGDDVNAGFQAPVDIAVEGDRIEISILFQNGSSSLQSLVKGRKAAYVVHLECSSTFFRESFEAYDGELTIKLPRTAVHGRVAGVAMAVGKTRIPKYKVNSSHPDYGKRTFEIEPGDILALSEPFRFDVDVEAEDLQRISSIMVICPDHDRDEGEMRVLWQEPRIKIMLPKEDFAHYMMVRQNPLAHSLAGMLVAFPVLAEAVRLVISADSGVSDLRWYRCIRRRIDELAISETEDPLAIAQKILANPVSRSLLQSFNTLDFSD